MAQKEASLLLKIKTAGEDALDRVGSGLKVLGGIATAAFGLISAAVVKAVGEFEEQEQATNALTRAMVNQGVYSRELAKSYKEQSDELSSLTAVGGEQITGAQAILQAHLGEMKVSKELTMATLDLAQAKGIDLKTAAEMVGKTIGTKTNALARNGIEVNTNASKQEKLAQVLDSVNSKFGGQAVAATQGLGGGLKVVSEVINNLFEAIGERLAPVIILFTNKFRTLAADTGTVNSIMSAFVGTVQLLTNAGVIVSGVFQAVAGVLGTGLAAAIESVSALVKGNFTQAFQLAKLGVTESGSAITKGYADTKDRMQEVNAAFAESQAEDLAKEEQLEKESIARRGEVRQKAATDEAIKAREQQIAQQEIDMQLLTASEEQKSLAQIEAQIKTQQEIYKNASTAGAKLGALNSIYRLNEQKAEEIANQQKIKNRGDTFATIASLQNSNNKALAVAGKAAAVTQIAIETPVAIAKALSAFPPPFNFVAAGLVGVAMAAQAANIAGVPLAEGGIVMPRPGGTQATIGEAGQAEAVIPLDRMSEFGMGGGGASVTIVSYGGLLGSESEAREFARAVDRELLKLRQNNESVSFDSGVV